MIKAIFDPDYKSQTVTILYKDGTTEKNVQTHLDISGESFYIIIEGGRINFWEWEPNGDWLNQMLK